ncbi:hypothetical protein Rpal_3047 [Rhodopseudomonas palustris TIE-1]|nr:hypothetical protein Rpal_3047 [Rhodopseudomonas palustris TIE-1]
MREEIAELAGPRTWGDTRQSWLSRVPRAVKRVLGTTGETVSYRAIKSLWYGEITDPEHHAARDVRRAAQIVRAQKSASELASHFENLIGGVNAADGANLYRDEIARLERVVSLLRGQSSAGDCSGI